MNDDTADAVEQRPPEAPQQPRRRRRPAKPDTGNDAASASAEGVDRGSGGEDGKPPPKRPRTRSPKSAGEPAETEAAEESTSRGSRSGKNQKTSDPPLEGRDGDEGKPPPKRRTSRKKSEEELPASQAAGKQDDTASEKEAKPARKPSSRRPKPPDAEAAGKSDPPVPPAEESAGMEAEESSGKGQDGQVEGAVSRRRRRRSRRGGGGGGSADAKGDKGPAKPDSQDKGKPDKGKPDKGKPDKGKPAASGDSNGDRGSRPSGGGRRRRRSSRRPKLQDIAPLGPRKMLITVREDRCQIAVLEGRELIEHYVAKTDDLSTVGNIYVGRVENVLPGMEAAFLDIGESRNAVLYVGEVSYDEDVEGPSPRIEALLKSGQSVVAQVTKDAMGSKGARLTTEVSLAGRYLVLVPGSDSLGISRRLGDAERRRLRDIAGRIKPAGQGMIVRTAANGTSEQDLERDMKRLVRIWNETSQRIEGAKPPKLVYAEPPLAIRVIRDLFTADVEQVIVDDKDVYEEVRSYLEEVTPELQDRVEYYDEKLALYDRYHVMEQIRKAVDRKVWLASGGHIVIDRTEAMTVIDVNTGRFVGRSTLEDTVLHANLEAAEEIAKQLRLRDIGGIIVVDFIDMGFERNRDELIRVFENALLRDKTRTQVYGVSELGLVQMTRKKVSEGLLEAFSKPCDKCEGRGRILTDLD